MSAIPLTLDKSRVWDYNVLEIVEIPYSGGYPAILGIIH